MITLTALVFSTLVSANFWGFEDYTDQDWAALENSYLQQRADSARALRTRVKKFAARRGGIVAIQEWAVDGVDRPITDIQFETGTKESCMASISKAEIVCRPK